MAPSGMTGFARTEGATDAWTWSVEVRSVNGRNFELRWRAPPTFDSLEREVRANAQRRFHRGQIQLTLQASRRAEVAGAIDHAVLDRLIEASRRYVEAGTVAAPRFDGLLRAPGVLASTDAPETAAARADLDARITRSLTDALVGLEASRHDEGRALGMVLQDLVNAISGLVASAGAQAGEQGPVIKARFAQRLNELAGTALPDERVAQEAAILAQKADVREELDRLTAHVAAARALLQTQGPVGRKFDFLTQEFMREANTLCAKSASTALTATGLELKVVVDQLREQVQNVE